MILYLPRLWRVADQERKAASILYDMLDELHKRLDAQDRKIADHLVRLDLLEAKTGRIFERDMVLSKVLPQEKS